MFIKYDYTADGKPIMVEVTEEVAEFLREDKRVTGNADRRERDHCEFHMDAMDYEGEAFAYRETPEQILLRKERDMALWKAMEVLSNTQFRRLILYADGMSFREIAPWKARISPALQSPSMPQRKKYEIFCDNTPTKRLPNLRIMRGNMPGMEVNRIGQSQ